MTEESPNGYVIGFRELYESIQSLDRKLDAQLGEAAKTLVQHSERIKSLEDQSASKRQMTGVWLTCATALIASFVGLYGSVILHH